MADEGKDAGSPAGVPRAAILPDDVSDATPSIPERAPSRHRRPVDGRGGLSEHTRKRLAAQLRTMYDAVAQQPVPDRFAELIAKLDGGGRENV